MVAVPPLSSSRLRGGGRDAPGGVGAELLDLVGCDLRARLAISWPRHSRAEAGRLLSGLPKSHPVQPLVDSAAVHQFAVRSHVDNAAAIHDQDAVGQVERREAVLGRVFGGRLRLGRRLDV